MISFGICVCREKDNHRKLRWEHEGDGGDAGVLEGEGSEFDD